MSWQQNDETNETARGSSDGLHRVEKILLSKAEKERQQENAAIGNKEIPLLKYGTSMMIQYKTIGRIKFENMSGRPLGCQSESGKASRNWAEALL